MAKFTGSGSLIMPGVDARVYDCEFQTSAASQSASILCQGQRARVIGCRITNSEIGVDIQQDDGWVIDCSIQVTSIGVNVDDHGAVVEGNTIRVLSSGGATGVLINSGLRSRVAHNAISGTGELTMIEGGNAVVEGNMLELIDDQIGIWMPDGGVVNGNNIDGNNVTSGSIGILLGGTMGEAVVTANRLRTLFHGIVAGGTTPAVVLVADNLVWQPEGHGIDFGSASNSFAIVIRDNLIDSPGQDAGDSYDGIRVHGTRPRVLGNVIIPETTPGTRSGVNDVGATHAIIVGNDLGDPADYATDALILNGTDVQLTYPNDPTYGDNFTVGASGS